jgi:hypothetical protein
MAVIQGKALFSSTKAPDMKFGAPGSYYVVLAVSPEDYADAEALGLKCKRNVYKGEEQLTVQLKLKGGGKRKDGSDYINESPKVILKTPSDPKSPYVEKARNEHGELVTTQKEIPYGSSIKVSYKSRSWEMMGKTGTSFDLRAVQILEEGGSNDPLDEFGDDEDDSDDGDF